MSDMNVVALIGRATKDPDIRYGELAVARYTLAVNRKGKKQEGKPSADFISCVCFGKSAEFAEKYVHKGTRIGITGHIQTGSYTNKDGVKVYTTDVIVDDHTFCESSKGSIETVDSGFAPAEEGFLPFT